MTCTYTLRIAFSPEAQAQIAALSEAVRRVGMLGQAAIDACQPLVRDIEAPGDWETSTSVVDGTVVLSASGRLQDALTRLRAIEAQFGPPSEGAC